MPTNNSVQVLRFRWFNDACYELKLPNGKGILVDPYIDESEYRILSSRDVEAADYILISHSHFDHTLDLAVISDRFDSQIFAGELSGIEIARRYDVPGYRMNLCSPGETRVTDDFKLEVFRGKHTKLPASIDRPSRWVDNVAEHGEGPEATEINMLGSYEYMIYLLTLPSNFRILIWGGGATQSAIIQAQGWKPNFSIAQLPRENTDIIARLYASIGGQVIVPHHHDYFIARGEEGEKIITETVTKTKALAPSTLVFCPEKGRWYSINTAIIQD